MPTGYLLVVQPVNTDTYEIFHAPTELEAIGAGARLLRPVRDYTERLVVNPVGTILEHDGYRMRLLAADYTEDGHPILPGARLFNYYDRWWCTVAPEPFMSGLPSAPGGQFFDGWYDITRESDGWLCKLNGARLATKDLTT